MTPSKLSAIPKYTEVQADPEVLKNFNDDVVEEFRANGGKVGGPFADSDIVLLTMTGAKSGRRRLTPLEYFPIDGRIVLIGTYGGAPKDPLWVHNLRAHPQAHVEVGGDSYDVIAREVSGDERDALFAKVRETRPRIGTYPGTARIIPVFELLRTD
ncbi:MAG: nitroreductase/quinone reductase family protein [Mycobacterium sp.]